MSYKTYLFYAAIGLSFALGLLLMKQESRHSQKARSASYILGFIACMSGVIAAIAVGYYSSNLAIFLTEFFSLSEMMREITLQPLDFGIRSDTPYFYQVFAVLLVPIMEEIWYRELTLTQARRALGSGFGILLSAFLFAISHFGAFPDLFSFISAAPSFFLSGIMLGIIRINHGLFYSILSHCFLNYLGIKIHNMAFDSSLIILGVALVTSAIYGAICYRVQRS